MNNIFSALIHRRNADVIREFVLWCILCFEILLFMISAAVAGSKITWIMLMIFTIGMAVLMIFRLTAIALLYSLGVFHLLSVIILYMCYHSALSVTTMLIFVLVILLALAAFICSFIHNFSRFNLDKAVMALAVSDSVFIMILQILLYTGKDSAYNFLRGLAGSGADFRGYWAGTISFWLLLAVIDVYDIFFSFGLIDNGRNKIIHSGHGDRPDHFANQEVPAAVQGISGACAGQTFYLKNRELIIGSTKTSGASLVIPDGHVSRWHCAVRYHSGRGGDGFYEILDRSTNGVYLNTGGRLSQNMWNRLPRGSVICIGGMRQQFRLL